MMSWEGRSDGGDIKLGGYFFPEQVPKSWCMLCAWMRQQQHWHSAGRGEKRDLGSMHRETYLHLEMHY